jgi:hypothetical protein
VDSLRDWRPSPERGPAQTEGQSHAIPWRPYFTTNEGLLETHRLFCELLLDEMLWVENPDTGERLRVLPGGASDVLCHVTSEPVFRAIGGYFANFSSSVNRISEEIYSRQSVYLSYT